MKNKILASLVVVGLCAVAFVGVGLAYSASVTSDDIAMTSSYVSINMTNPSDQIDVAYDYEKVGDADAEYTVATAGEVGATIQLTTKNAELNGKLVVTVEYSGITATAGTYSIVNGVNDQAASSTGGKLSFEIATATADAVTFTVQLTEGTITGTPLDSSTYTITAKYVENSDTEPGQ